MRKLYFITVLIIFISFSCSKGINSKLGTCSTNEPPTIKIISPIGTPTLKPGDQLQVKATFTDHDIIYVASWEALRASAVCGNNPYSGQYEPKTYEYEMNFTFFIPPNFAGDQVIRLYGVDGQGNISQKDIIYKATN